MTVAVFASEAAVGFMIGFSFRSEVTTWIQKLFSVKCKIFSKMRWDF